MLLGIILLFSFFVAPAAAQAAPDVSTQIDLSNGGPVVNEQPSPVKCVSLPCVVHVKVTNPSGQSEAGKPIKAVDWYENNLSPPVHHSETGPSVRS